MAARIPHLGFTPGQNIDLLFNIHNKSSEDVQAVLVQILKEVAFDFNQILNEKATDSSVLSDQTLDGFDTRDTDMKTYRIKIVVPSTPPTDEKTCSIIKITYKLRVSANNMSILYISCKDFLFRIDYCCCWIMSC